MYLRAIVALSMVLCIPAVAQSELPKGWFLHEDLAPTLTLAYYDPSSGDVGFAVTCTEGYVDTIVAFYPRTGASTEARPVQLVLAQADRSLTIEGTAQVYNDRYTIDGQTIMDDHLAALLQGGFTLVAEGHTEASFPTGEGDREHVRRLTQACRS